MPCKYLRYQKFVPARDSKISILHQNSSMISFRSLITSLSAGILISSLVFNRNLMRDIEWTFIKLKNTKSKTSVECIDQSVDEVEEVMEPDAQSLDWNDEFEVVNDSMCTKNEPEQDKSDLVQMLIEEAVKTVESYEQ